VGAGSVVAGGVVSVAGGVSAVPGMKNMTARMIIASTIMPMITLRFMVFSPLLTIIFDRLHDGE
jgi:hypothetical protein